MLAAAEGNHRKAVLSRFDRHVEQEGTVRGQALGGCLREQLQKIPGIRHSKSSFALRTLKKADTPLTS